MVRTSRMCTAGCGPPRVHSRSWISSCSREQSLQGTHLQMVCSGQTAGRWAGPPSILAPRSSGLHTGAIPRDSAKQDQIRLDVRVQQPFLPPIENTQQPPARLVDLHKADAHREVDVARRGGNAAKDGVHDLWDDAARCACAWDTAARHSVQSSSVRQCVLQHTTKQGMYCWPLGSTHPCRTPACQLRCSTHLRRPCRA